MKNDILNLVKSAVWYGLVFIVGTLAFKGVLSLGNSNKPAKEFSTTVFAEKGHDYLIVDTKHGVFRN